MKKIDNNTVYEGIVVDVIRSKFKQKDTLLNIEQVTHPGGVCVAALHNNKFLMVKQYRFGIEAPLLEFPAGLIDPGEDPKVSALRELQEETGYKAQTIVDLGKLYLSPGYSNETIYLYFASDLEFVGTNFDPFEDIELFELTIDEIIDRDLNDAKTVGLLHRVMKYLNTSHKK